jgi:hypothetical protein
MDLYRKTAGDLDQDERQRRIEQAHQKSYDWYIAGWAVEDLISVSEDEDEEAVLQATADRLREPYSNSPTNEAEAQKRIESIRICKPLRI